MAYHVLSKYHTHIHTHMQTHATHNTAKATHTGFERHRHLIPEPQKQTSVTVIEVASFSETCFSSLVYFVLFLHLEILKKDKTRNTTTRRVLQWRPKNLDHHFGLSLHIYKMANILSPHTFCRRHLSFRRSMHAQFTEKQCAKGEMTGIVGFLLPLEKIQGSPEQFRSDEMANGSR